MQFYLPFLALAMTFLVGANAIPTAETNHTARDLNMAMDGGLRRAREERSSAGSDMRRQSCCHRIETGCSGCCI